MSGKCELIRQVHAKSESRLCTPNRAGEEILGVVVECRESGLLCGTYSEDDIPSPLELGEKKD